MEPDEIAVVLSRASDLHAKLNNAIDLLAKSPDSQAPSPSSIDNLDTGEIDTAAELLSLVAIRDALEVLKNQLEALQALQQQQRAERDTGLARIEESRLALLKRLKEHRGRHVEIVQDALLFAGDATADNEDLPLPPYPRLLDGETSQQRQHFPGSFRASGSRTPFAVQEQHESKSDVDLDRESRDGNESEQDTAFTSALKSVKDSGAMFFLAVRNSGASAIDAVKKSQALNFAVKTAKYGVSMLGQYTCQVKVKNSVAAFLAVSAIASLCAADMGRRKRKEKPALRESKPPISGSSHNHSCDAAGSVTSKAEGSAKDDFPKYGVRERIELPIYQELITIPDVLDGRG